MQSRCGAARTPPSRPRGHWGATLKDPPTSTVRPMKSAPQGPSASNATRAQDLVGAGGSCADAAAAWPPYTARGHRRPESSRTSTE